MRARTLLLVLLAATPACKKADQKAVAPSVPYSPADADALWAMAPADVITGLVISPRGVGLLEDAASAVQALAQQPELAPVTAGPQAKVSVALGGRFTNLAALGLDRTRGVAMWETKDGGQVALLPVADLARLQKLTGDTAPDQLAGQTCKQLAAHFACANDPALLDGLGKAKAKLPAALTALGARGDIEFVVAGAVPSVGVVQLERGAATLRLDGVMPPVMAKMMTGKQKPRVDASTVGFGVAGLGPVLAMMSDAPLAPGVTLHQLAGAINGPLTITLAAGGTSPDLRVPLSDPAMVKGVIAHCADLLPPNMIAATQPPGGCRIVVPDYGSMEVDLWVDGNQLRIGNRTAPVTAAASVPMTPLGKELADAEWAFAFWGRGTALGGTSTTMLPPTMPGGVAMVARLMSLFSELGIGFRLDGDRAHVVIGVRTIWANPPDVTAKLLAIPAEQLLTGKRDTVDAIAGAAPSSPFAQDLKAGQGGLMVPAAVTGMLAAVAIPAFLDYGKKGRRSEAELNLTAISKGAKSAYAENAELPKGSAPLTPAQACCSFPDRRCPANTADWVGTAWDALDFETSEPSYYQYAYQSDGKTLTATAVGDLDCDGESATWTLTVTTDGGTPEVSLTKPPRPD